jgi:hypothetical protein
MTKRFRVVVPAAVLLLAACEHGPLGPALFFTPSFATSEFSDAASFFAGWGGPTTLIDFATDDAGNSLTGGAWPAVFSPSLDLRGVAFSISPRNTVLPTPLIRVWGDLFMGAQRGAVIRATLPPGSRAVGMKLGTYNGAAGTFRIELSNGEVYFRGYTGGVFPIFFSVVADAPIDWIDIFYAEDIHLIDDFVFGVDDAPPPFDFTGFFAPVNNLPTLNVTKAGSAIPVKFSLGGDRGLEIFVSGYPNSNTIACEQSLPLDQVEETTTASNSGLSYDVAKDQYTYVWKTEKSWGGKCRDLALKLSDGSEHKAHFKFSK